MEPIVATGTLYDPYIIAARKNLEALVKLTTEHGDKDFILAAETLLNGFDADVEELNQLIDEANVELTDDCDDTFWREHPYAIALGLGEAA